jgi:hypothetical protein
VSFGHLKGGLQLDSDHTNTDFLDFYVGQGGVNNHLSKNNMSSGAFDYKIAFHKAETKKILVPTRFTTINTIRVGDSTNLVDKLTNQLLAINSGDLNQDTNFLNVFYQKILATIPSRNAIFVDSVTTQPALIFISVDLPIRFYGCVYKGTSYLLWSTESEVEASLKTKFADNLMVYRLPSLLNGVTILQSLYLKKKINKWNSLNSDRLLFMSTLEEYIKRKTLFL